jgi:hypothetical protein
MKRNEIIIILVSILTVVVLWIGSNIYHNSATTTVTNIENLQILSINPGFDVNTINQLKKREKLTPFYKESTNSATPTPTLTPIPLPTPISTGSAVSSQGGLLN